MAEALAAIAVASSIISVVQVSAQVVQLGWECVKLYRSGAPEGLDELVEELTMVHEFAISEIRIAIESLDH
jgi:type IV secretory pathway TrbF-like protein